MKEYSQKLKNLVEYRKNNKTIVNYVRKGSKLLELLELETKFLKNSISSIERLYYVENNIFEQINCSICNKPTKIGYRNKTYKIQSCSNKCACQVINKKTGLTKSQQTAKDSNITKSIKDPVNGLSINDIIGTKSNNIKSIKDPVNGLSINDIIKEKRHITMSKIDENGLTGYQKSSKISAKTMAAINPNTNISINNIIKEKRHITMSKINENGLTGYQKMGYKVKTQKYNDLSTSFSEKYKLLTTLDEYLKNNHTIKYQCIKCNNIYNTNRHYIRCTECNPYNKSIGENEVLEFCKSLTNDIISNSRSIITPLELDIYIPNNNLAIEYNGLYYHSSDSKDSENKDYHLYKTQECEKRGIQLFHIFENEWQNPQKQKIWKSIIKNRLGKSERIFARKTILKPLSSTEKSQFLISNHLQGDCVSSVNLGLYMGDELVSLMTFGRSRYNKNVEWELLRFCNKVGCSVIGGSSRLLKAFRKENLGSIISYADKRRSSGNLYKQLGFEFSHESDPNYFYWKPGSMMLESRIGYQKHKLKDKLEVFDPSLAESENMYRNGFRKIYDCGNQVWILN